MKREIQARRGTVIAVDTIEEYRELVADNPSLKAQLELAEANLQEPLNTDWIGDTYARHPKGTVFRLVLPGEPETGWMDFFYEDAGKPTWNAIKPLVGLVLHHFDRPLRTPVIPPK